VPQTVIGRYSPLQRYVARVGGMRVSMHGGLRERLVEICVEEFPVDAREDQMEAVLVARVRSRARQQYGSVVAFILVSILTQLIVKAVIAWWKNHHSHQVLMYGWHKEATQRAKKDSDV
jgi:hypothetical protein